MRGNSSVTWQTKSLHDHGKSPQQRHRNTKDSFQLTGLLFESRNHGRKMANRQVEALCRPGDVLVLHSTSGQSANLLAAARAARKLGVATVAFLGRGGGALASEVDESVIVPDDETSRIQVLHLVLEHVVVELVEAEVLRP